MQRDDLTGIIDGNVIVPHGGSCTIGNSYGMLQVNLVHEVPEGRVISVHMAKPRKVAIGASEPAQPQVTEQTAAA